MRIKFALLAFIIVGGFASIAITGCGDKDSDSAEEVETEGEEVEETTEEEGEE